MSDDYDVGYKRPPKSGQFKPGRSGNPRGRPKGSKRKTSMDSLEEILNEKMLIREDGVEKEVTVLDALYKRLAAEALKGNMQAMRMTLKYIEIWDKEISKQEEKEDQKCITLEIVRSYNSE